MKEKLEKEIARCRGLVEVYESIPTGGFGTHMIKASISRAERAIESGSINQMSNALRDLEEIEG